MANDYRLSGPQVEPAASYWNRCPVPRPVTLEELLAVTDAGDPPFFPDYPDDPVTECEFEELLYLQARRDDPTQLVGTIDDPALRQCLEAAGEDPRRCPISLFLQLRPPP